MVVSHKNRPDHNRKPTQAPRHITTCFFSRMVVVVLQVLDKATKCFSHGFGTSCAGPKSLELLDHFTDAVSFFVVRIFSNCLVHNIYLGRIPFVVSECKTAGALLAASTVESVVEFFNVPFWINFCPVDPYKTSSFVAKQYRGEELNSENPPKPKLFPEVQPSMSYLTSA